MRAWLILILTVLAIPAARAQQMCADIFRENRGAYADRLRQAGQRNGPSAGQLAQKRVDFERRLLKNLFVETDLYLRDTTTGKWLTQPPQPTMEHVSRRLSDILQSFDPHGSIAKGTIAPDIRSNPSKLGALAVKYKVTIQQMDQILETLHMAVYERSDEAAEFLIKTFAASQTRFNVANDQAFRAQQAADKAVDLKTARGSGKTRGKLSPVGAPGFIATAGAITAALGAFHGFDGWTMLALPGGLGGALGSMHFYHEVPGYTTARKLFHNARARRQSKLIARDMRRVFKETEPVKARENADFAFEKAWEDWRISALQAEGGRNKARLERVTDRMAQLSLLIQTLKFWEMPNGERYADILKLEGDALDGSRLAGLREGTERKTNQLDLMITELRWLEHDLSQVATDLTRPDSRAYDEAVVATYQQMLDTMNGNLQGLRKLIEDRQDQLQFMAEMIASPLPVLRNYVATLAQEGPPK